MKPDLLMRIVYGILAAFAVVILSITYWVL